jgi:hypothetical protein
MYCNLASSRAEVEEVSYATKASTSTHSRDECLVFKHAILEESKLLELLYGIFRVGHVWQSNIDLSDQYSFMYYESLKGRETFDNHIP